MSTNLLPGKSPSALLASYQTIGDVELTICAELDRCVISGRRLLNLEIGDLLTLSRPAGENINLYAGDILLASAEILVAEEKIGVRIAELADRAAQAPVNKHVDSVQEDSPDE